MFFSGEVEEEELVFKTRGEERKEVAFFSTVISFFLLLFFALSFRSFGLEEADPSCLEESPNFLERRVLKVKVYTSGSLETRIRKGIKKA